MSDTKIFLLPNGQIEPQSTKKAKGDSLPRRNFLPEKKWDLEAQPATQIDPRDGGMVRTRVSFLNSSQLSLCLRQAALSG